MKNMTFPIVHFGFWRETLLKWQKDIDKEAMEWSDGNEIDKDISETGFRF